MYKLVNTSDITKQKAEILKLTEELGPILALDEFDFKEYNKEIKRVTEIVFACQEYKALLNSNIRMT